jgi:hypothetical protein
MNQTNTAKIMQKKNKTKKPLSMPSFKCTCGAKILIVPDLGAMDRAIKNHVAEHPVVNEDFLAEQVIKTLSKHIGS